MLTSVKRSRAVTLHSDCLKINSLVIYRKPYMSDKGDLGIKNVGEYIIGGKGNAITDGVAQSFMHKATSEMHGAASSDSLPLTQQGTRVTYLKQYTDGSSS